MRVDKDKIEVGCSGHFASTQPPHADHAHLTACNYPMGDGHLVQAGIKQGCNCRLGHVGEAMPGLEAVDLPLQQLQPDAKLLVLRPSPDRIERFLQASAWPHQQPQALVKLLQPRLMSQELGIDQHIQKPGPRCKMICKPRRSPDNVCDQSQEIRIGQKQGKDLHTCWKARQEPIEACECDIGVGRFGEGIEQQWHQRSQFLACTLAAGCPYPAVVPAPDGG